MPKNWKLSVNALGIKNCDLLLNEIFEDINASFFLALFGQYRSAHMHMRSSIELLFQFLYFVHHPIELTKWTRGEFIMKFDKISEYLISHPHFKMNVTQVINSIAGKLEEFFQAYSWRIADFFFNAKPTCEKRIPSRRKISDLERQLQ